MSFAQHKTSAIDVDGVRIEEAPFIQAESSVNVVVKCEAKTINVLSLSPKQKDNTYREETWENLKLTVPLIAANFLNYLMILQDQAILGHMLTKDDLAAAALANTFINVFWYFMAGVGTQIFFFNAAGSVELTTFSPFSFYMLSSGF